LISDPFLAAGRGIWLLPRCANRTSDTLSWLPNGAAVTVLDVLHSPEPRAGGIASYHAGWNRQRHRETENRELPEFLTKRYATINSENDMRLIAGSEKKRRTNEWKLGLGGGWLHRTLDNCLPSTAQERKPQSLKTPRAKAAKASLSAQQPALPPAFPLFFPILSLIPPFRPSRGCLLTCIGVLIDLVLPQYSTLSMSLSMMIIHDGLSMFRVPWASFNTHTHTHTPSPCRSPHALSQFPFSPFPSLSLHRTSYWVMHIPRQPQRLTRQTRRASSLPSLPRGPWGVLQQRTNYDALCDSHSVPSPQSWGMGMG
jgi:hypothetical protein